MGSSLRMRRVVAVSSILIFLSLSVNSVNGLLDKLENMMELIAEGLENAPKPWDLEGVNPEDFIANFPNLFAAMEDHWYWRNVKQSSRHKCDRENIELKLYRRKQNPNEENFGPGTIWEMRLAAFEFQGKGCKNEGITVCNSASFYQPPGCIDNPQCMVEIKHEYCSDFPYPKSFGKVKGFINRSLKEKGRMIGNELYTEY